ncbi:SRPBCC family protein [Nocardia puris]|uniref:Polyketide cyclase/dehydrase/lipid transport protein n=1 Tax=Nocardia puris TaxID=208602 RepID=A0A366E2U8_9NOCA|nr:SRPBCC family protein [Nocardia puris]MBF6212743.1 SRPBCC family protein [Nocardia puris]MBF6367680.1 SRPBCC family protein [Nocardia puris]MBF6461331.1 SRPBCC family protein [Nocardia puris]RBO96435.1 polyketide cyclase/dehydrase/lipid transport protein [Nocardia puris]
MRYRDCPTIEVTRRVACTPEQAWKLVTDITFPARHSTEVESVEWIAPADRVAPGARFRGSNRHEALGAWQTECEVVEVEPERRWVYDVHGPDGVGATWGFEIDPARDGVIVRQWARMGPGSSGLSVAIASMPDKEARIVANRLAEWEQNMRATLAAIEAACGSAG